MLHHASQLTGFRNNILSCFICRSDNKHHEQSSNYTRDNGVGDDVTEHATRFFRCLNSRRGRWAYNGDLEESNVLGRSLSGPNSRVVHLADLRVLRNLPRVGRVE